MIGGVAKAYGWTPDYVLYEMSYANMILYSAVLPTGASSKKKEDTKKEIKATGINTQTMFDIFKQIKQ
jgi:hypothetical protein